MYKKISNLTWLRMVPGSTAILGYKFMAAKVTGVGLCPGKGLY